MSELEKKYSRLRTILQNSAPLAIAFSGGVDSAFLLKAAAETLPREKYLAVTARAAIFPAWELAEATALAQSLNAEWLSIEVDILAAPKVAENPPDRCYYCKKAIFQTLVDEAKKRGFPKAADGSNTSDAADFRPGARAIAELGVISPLKMAGLSKDDIRALSKGLALATWNKPAYACLASRFPYGHRISPEKLGQVEEAENILRTFGFPETRVRHHHDIARLEIAPQYFAKFLDETLMGDVNQKLKSLGFTYVTLDLAPYRRGSLNETVDASLLALYKQ